MIKVKVGDILEFEQPIHSWHKKDIENGARYIVEQFHKTKFYQTSDGWWHAIELPEFDELQLVLRGKKGSHNHGALKNFNNYKVIGNIND